MTAHDQWSKADKHEALDALYKAGFTADEAQASLPAVMMLADGGLIPPWQAADQFAAARARTLLVECDPIDDIQDHHDWDYETHGGCLGVCKSCGALSQGWEE